jgi:hypothetical protein
MDAASVLSAIRNGDAQLRQQAVEVLYATAVDLLEKDKCRDAASVFRLMVRAAPTDERAWIGLGECHAGVSQDRLALELFGQGMLACWPSVRCTLARARVLRRLGEDEAAVEALEQALDFATAAGDDDAIELVERERRTQ